MRHIPKVTPKSPSWQKLALKLTMYLTESQFWGLRGHKKHHTSGAACFACAHAPSWARIVSVQTAWSTAATFRNLSDWSMSHGVAQFAELGTRYC